MFIYFYSDYQIASVLTVAVEAKLVNKSVIPCHLKIDAYDSELYDIK